MLNTPELRKWIKVRLAEKGWNQADLARETDTTESTWTRVFQGRTKSLRGSNAQSICRIFNVTEKQLYAIALGEQTERTDAVQEPGELYETKWIRLGKWLETQPTAVQHAMGTICIQ